MFTFILGSLLLLACLLVILFVYPKVEPVWLRYFVYFLGGTLLFQAGGFLYSWYTQKSNHSLFNLYILGQFLFYFYIFGKAIQGRRFKILIYIICSIFLSFYLTNILLGQGWHQFNSYTYNVGGILTILCCFLYLFELFASETTIHYFRVPMFWISTGLLFFHAGTIAYMSLLSYINKNNIDPEGKVYEIVMVVLNVLLYLLLSMGFLSNRIWKKEKS
jgi:hypothetical protein